VFGESPERFLNEIGYIIILENTPPSGLIVAIWFAIDTRVATLNPKVFGCLIRSKKMWED
jgi:hypothetical protein